MPFKNQAGFTALPTLTPDGAVPVEDIGVEDGSANWLKRLCWEVEELRRVYCEAENQDFEEYPGT